MPDYPYRMQLAEDAAAPGSVARGATISFYAATDTAGTTLLALKDPSGNPLANPLTTTTDGFVPALIAPVDEIRWEGGGFHGFLTSYEGLKAEAVSAAASADSAAASAATAAADATSAVQTALAAAVGSAEVAASAAAASAALVGAPADEVMATAVTSVGTATHAALNATIATAVEAPISEAIAKRAGVAKTTDYTVTPADAGKVLTFSDGVDHTLTVPLASGAGIAAGCEFDIVSTGTGRIKLKPPAENLWPYPDGEAGTVGIWYGRVGNTSIVPGIGPDGDNVIRSTSTGTSTSGQFGMYSAIVKLSDMGLKVGDRISARMWISHITPATNARFQISFMAGASVVSNPAQTPVPNVGVRDVLNLLIPVGCDGIQIFVYTTSASAGQIVDIAQVMISKSSTALPAYRDGDSAGWYWTGLAHQSPSSNGILTGDRIVPKNGRVRLRHLGGDVWTTATMGVPDNVLTEGSALNIDRDNGQGGLIGPARNIGSASAAVTSNTAYAVRICPSRNMTIKSIGFRVVTPSGTDDPVDVAIVDAAGTRLVSSGSTTGKLTAAGSKTVPIGDTILTAGSVYYVVLTATSTASLLNASVLGDAFGTAMPMAEAMAKAATFPIGTTLTGMTFTNSAPFIWVKES